MKDYLLGFFITSFIFIMLILIMNLIANNSIYKYQDNKFEFLEKEFRKQITHQLGSTNIILFLDKNYSGEDVDAFLEKESGKFSLGLNNVIFHNNKVIYEFTNRMR